MGIKVSPKGETERAALAGQLIGGAQAAQRQIEHAQRVQEQLRSIAAQKEMAEFSQQLALERAKFNATMDLEGEKRARMWEIEKMELRSRLDFEEAEIKRRKKESEYEAGIEVIRDSDMTDSQKEDALFKLEMHHSAGYVPSIPVEKEVDPIKAYIRQKLGGVVQASASQQMQLGQTITDITGSGGGATGAWGEGMPAQQNRIRVVSPDGRTGSILASEWPQYESAGYRRI